MRCDRIAQYNRLRRVTRRCLSKVDQRDKDAFDRWLSQHRSSKNSQQVDLPSSRIAPKMSLINPNKAQLFVVVDTCSIVTFRNEFIDYIVRLKTLFSTKGSCPIKFIISLVVLEELDKCNRPNRRRPAKQEASDWRGENNGRNNNTDEGQNYEQSARPSTFTSYTSRLLKTKNRINEPEVVDLLAAADQSSKRSSEPPRMFMRFIEEEMRTSEIVISELDPYKKTKLADKELAFDVVNTDDRILDCCLRSRAFIRSHTHHIDTQAILLTEDNVFKSKATTFEVPSYRWLEFKAKFKNFGLEHYIATPLYGPNWTQYRSAGGGTSTQPRPFVSLFPSADEVRAAATSTESESDSDSDSDGDDDSKKPKVASASNFLTSKKGYSYPPDLFSVAAAASKANQTTVGATINSKQATSTRRLLKISGRKERVGKNKEACNFLKMPTPISIGSTLNDESVIFLEEVINIK